MLQGLDFVGTSARDAHPTPTRRHNALDDARDDTELARPSSRKTPRARCAASTPTSGRTEATRRAFVVGCRVQAWTSIERATRGKRRVRRAETGKGDANEA